MNFIAIDFETANAKQSPCAVGLVVVENNIVIDEYYTLINPGQPFGRANVSIHGITAKDVSEAPAFPEVWGKIGRYFGRFPVVAHNASFDKKVLEKALRRYKLHALPHVYYDTMGLYRDNYTNTEGLNLPSLCAAFGVVMEEYHNALSDAKAAAGVMIAMLSCAENDIYPSLVSGLYLDAPLRDESAEKAPSRSLSFMTGHEPELSATTATMDEVEAIVFSGSTFVISGVIAGYERSELEAIIQTRGGKVTSAVSKKTCYVVAGLQDVTVVKDGEGAKSGKILKAEALRAEGCNVRIIDANAFLLALQKVNE